MITVTIDDPIKEAGIAAACAAHNASLPTPAEGEESNALTPSQYIQMVINGACDSYVKQFKVGTIFASDYVLRFTATEWSAINDAAQTSPEIAGYLNRVKSLAEVRLWSEEMIAGHAYLVSNGFITQQRSNEILSF